MREYLLGVVVIALLCSVVMSVTPKNGSESAMRLVCGLCAVGVIAVPLVAVFDGEGLLDGVKDIFETEEAVPEYYDEIYNKNFDKAYVNNAEILLKNEIIQELSANDDGFDVNIVVGVKSDEKYIERVELIIYASGMSIDPHSVEKYINERLECPCIVVYDI